MSTIRNKVQLIGFLEENPEIRTAATGRKHARFSITHLLTYRNLQGKKVKEPQQHQIVAWGKLAEYAETDLKKGSQVGVSGKLVHRTYTDKDGIKKYITEVVINEILKLSGSYSKTP